MNITVIVNPFPGGADKDSDENDIKNGRTPGVPSNRLVFPIHIPYHMFPHIAISLS
ncbi:MAG: hypothetical protein J6334_13250 [Kiritimatiellae bacterium]|nr:hypothetical protein [Kiritimatiellia bacterium]